MTHFRIISAFLFLTVFSFSGDDYGSHGNLWKVVTEAEKSEIESLGDRFKKMIDAARTEQTMVRETIAFAEANGFERWQTPFKGKMKAGKRYYSVNRGRTIILWVTGKKPLASGMKLVNSHIDSVRLELKPHPIKEKNGVVVLDTLVHGGLKAYQWVNVPLGLSGRIDRKDGSTVWIDLGFKDDDPILLIPDLAPHVDKDFRKRTRADAIKREELDPILMGSPQKPEGDDEEWGNLADQAHAMLAKKFAIEADDWISADIQIVPTTRARDVGLDRSLIAAYGMDDRLTAIVNLFALAETESPEHTAMAYLVTDEEVGSGWNVGVSSEWFRKLVAEMIQSEKNEVTTLDIMNVFSATDMITADTTTATNPLWPGPQTPGNASLMHHGLVVKLYGPGKNPNSEFMARLRKLLDDGDVPWQTHSYKAGYGGGTISRFFTGMNMEVTDWGVGIWSMHSTYDVASKADIWALHKGFKAFFGD